MFNSRLLCPCFIGVEQTNQFHSQNKCFILDFENYYHLNFDQTDENIYTWIICSFHVLPVYVSFHILPVYVSFHVLPVYVSFHVLPVYVSFHVLPVYVSGMPWTLWRMI